MGRGIAIRGLRAFRGRDGFPNISTSFRRIGPHYGRRMALPDFIEIVPPEQPVSAEVTVPGSKSLTNRALILAALSDGETALRGALWSEDTQVMVACLRELGFMINVSPDPREICNRTITVYGGGGRIPPGGTTNRPLELFAGNAGTVARFLTAMTCLGTGVYRLDGTARMRERPQESLFKALRSLGYRLDADSNRLPVLVHGAGRRRGKTQVNIEDSSQFASALLLCAGTGGWEVEVKGENAEESPYVSMTTQLSAGFPRSGGEFRIEPDASSGSYFHAAGFLLGSSGSDEAEIRVAHWPTSGWQVDGKFPEYLPLPKTVSRRVDLGDSIMTAIVLAPFGRHEVLFTELGRLRVQECERVVALRTELTKCGARVVESDDSLTIAPSKLHGAEIATYDDHRMAMCFAILALKVPGIKIKNPACVKKTFPDFFQKLADSPPSGLGATIVNPGTGLVLTGRDLFAE